MGKRGALGLEQAPLGGGGVEPCCRVDLCFYPSRAPWAPAVTMSPDGARSQGGNSAPAWEQTHLQV